MPFVALTRTSGHEHDSPGLDDEVFPGHQGAGGDEEDHWSLWTFRTATGELLNVWKLLFIVTGNFLSKLKNLCFERSENCNWNAWNLVKFCAEVGRKKCYLSWDITLKIIKLAGIFFYCKRRISQCFIFPFF